MVKYEPKMSNMVISALRNLHKAQGSSTKEIINYIKSHYNRRPNLERRLVAALKRGTEFGILTHNNGSYALNMAADLPLLISPSGAVEARARRRKSDQRKPRSEKPQKSARKTKSKKIHRGGRKEHRSSIDRDKKSDNKYCRCNEKSKHNSSVHENQDYMVCKCGGGAKEDPQTGHGKSSERSSTQSGSSLISDPEPIDNQ